MADGKGSRESHHSENLDSRVKLRHWQTGKEEEYMRRLEEDRIKPYSAEEILVVLDGIDQVRRRLDMEDLTRFVGEPFSWPDDQSVEKIWVHVPVAGRFVVLTLRPADTTRDLQRVARIAAEKIASVLARYELDRAWRLAVAYRPYEAGYCPPERTLQAANLSNEALMVALAADAGRTRSYSLLEEYRAAIRELER